MKIVYVSSPYSEGRRKENIKYAKDACRYVAESGHAFFASHLLYPQIMDDKQPGERKHGMDMGLAVLSKCDELWAFGVVVTDGMKKEIEEAERLGIPVKHFVEFRETRKGPRLVQPSWRRWSKS